MNSIYISSVLVLLALYAWFAHRRIKNLSKRLDQINDRLYGWGAESRSSFERLEKTLKALEFDRKRLAGELYVAPDMLISDVLAIHPRMSEVLAAMHLGGCSGCSVSSVETIGQGAASYGLDIDRILVEIQEFLKNPDDYRAEPQPHGGVNKTVQIQLPEAVDKP